MEGGVVGKGRDGAKRRGGWSIARGHGKVVPGNADFNEQVEALQREFRELRAEFGDWPKRGVKASPRGKQNGQNGVAFGSRAKLGRGRGDGEAGGLYRAALGWGKGSSGQDAIKAGRRPSPRWNEASPRDAEGLRGAARPRTRQHINEVFTSGSPGNGSCGKVEGEGSEGSSWDEPVPSVLSQALKGGLSIAIDGWGHARDGNSSDSSEEVMSTPTGSRNMSPTRLYTSEAEFPMWPGCGSAAEIRSYTPFGAEDDDDEEGDSPLGNWGHAPRSPSAPCLTDDHLTDDHEFGSAWRAEIGQKSEDELKQELPARSGLPEVVTRPGQAFSTPRSPSAPCLTDDHGFGSVWHTEFGQNGEDEPKRELPARSALPEVVTQRGQAAGTPSLLLESPHRPSSFSLHEMYKIGGRGGGEGSPGVTGRSKSCAALSRPDVANDDEDGDTFAFCSVGKGFKGKDLDVGHAGSEGEGSRGEASPLDDPEQRTEAVCAVFEFLRDMKMSLTRGIGSMQTRAAELQERQGMVEGQPRSPLPPSRPRSLPGARSAGGRVFPAPVETRCASASGAEFRKIGQEAENPFGRECAEGRKIGHEMEWPSWHALAPVVPGMEAGVVGSEQAKAEDSNGKVQGFVVDAPFRSFSVPAIPKSPCAKIGGGKRQGTLSDVDECMAKALGVAGSGGDVANGRREPGAQTIGGEGFVRANGSYARRGSTGSMFTYRVALGDQGPPLPVEKGKAWGEMVGKIGYGDRVGQDDGLLGQGALFSPKLEGEGASGAAEQNAGGPVHGQECTGEEEPVGVLTQVCPLEEPDVVDSEEDPDVSDTKKNPAAVDNEKCPAVVDAAKCPRVVDSEKRPGVADGERNQDVADVVKCPRVVDSEKHPGVADGERDPDVVDVAKGPRVVDGEKRPGAADVERGPDVVSSEADRSCEAGRDWSEDEDDFVSSPLQGSLDMAADLVLSDNCTDGSQGSVKDVEVGEMEVEINPGPEEQNVLVVVADCLSDGVGDAVEEGASGECALAVATTDFEEGKGGALLQDVWSAKTEVERNLFGGATGVCGVAESLQAGQMLGESASMDDAVLSSNGATVEAPPLVDAGINHVEGTGSAANRAGFLDCLAEGSKEMREDKPGWVCAVECSKVSNKDNLGQETDGSVDNDEKVLEDEVLGEQGVQHLKMEIHAARADLSKVAVNSMLLWPKAELGNTSVDSGVAHKAMESLEDTPPRDCLTLKVQPGAGGKALWASDVPPSVSCTQSLVPPEDGECSCHSDRSLWTPRSRASSQGLFSAASFPAAGNQERGEGLVDDGCCERSAVQQLSSFQDGRGALKEATVVQKQVPSSPSLPSKWSGTGFSSFLKGPRVSLGEGNTVAWSQSEGAQCDFVVSEHAYSRGIVEVVVEVEQLEGWAFVGAIGNAEPREVQPGSLAESPWSYGWSNECELYSGDHYYFESAQEMIRTGTVFHLVLDLMRSRLCLQFPEASRAREHGCHGRFFMCELGAMPRKDWRIVFEWLGSARIRLTQVESFV